MTADARGVSHVNYQKSMFHIAVLVGLKRLLASATRGVGSHKIDGLGHPMLLLGSHNALPPDMVGSAKYTFKPLVKVNLEMHTHTMARST